MKAQLITFQLTDSEFEKRLIDRIKTYDKWARLVDSTWVVITDNSSKEIRDQLRDTIDQNGHIFVINVTGQGWGSYSISKEVADWLKSNLKQ
jgi:hypothetical protein